MDRRNFLKVVGSASLAASSPLIASGNDTIKATRRSPLIAEPRAREYDVVIYGGTSSGITAAIQAAKMGQSVVIVSPTEHLGGLTAGGLGRTDSGDTSAIGGLSREFYRRIHDYYSQSRVWVEGERGEYPHYESGADAMWRFEPHAAAEIYHRWLNEYGIPVRTGAQLDRSNGTLVRDGQIQWIQTLNGDRYVGEVFLDCTYVGDLMATAGVSYTVGRESNSTYNETLNGAQKENSVNHQFRRPVSPYVERDNPGSGLLPKVHGGRPGEDGAGDHRVQAYCYRMCLTDQAENRKPFPKPAGYDPRDYELLLRYYEAGFDEMPWINSLMPNRKTDTNNRTPFSTDNIGKNYNYPEASYKERRRIEEEHEAYQKGVMWTLANHPRIPEQIRSQISEWGLARDEFTGNGNWPHQLYIREARRMVGDYVMTESDCRRTADTPRSVGLGSYNMDSHNCQRYVTADGQVRNEGNIEVSPGGPYEISYGSLVPKRAEVTNLLVPVCLSASHISYGSIRMEPVFMILGQSAATAASFAVDDDIAVQDVEYNRLRQRLLEDGQVLDTDAAPNPPQEG
jgi:hypothetical protein